MQDPTTPKHNYEAIGLVIDAHDPETKVTVARIVAYGHADTRVGGEECLEINRFPPPPGPAVLVFGERWACVPGLQMGTDPSPALVHAIDLLRGLTKPAYVGTMIRNVRPVSASSERLEIVAYDRATNGETRTLPPEGAGPLALRLVLGSPTDRMREYARLAVQAVSPDGVQTIARGNVSMLRLERGTPMFDVLQALNQESGQADKIEFNIPIGPLPKYEIPRSETWLPSGGPAPQPYQGEPMRGWERVLELARQLDEGKGRDPGKAVELANLITALHDELAEPEEPTLAGVDIGTDPHAEPYTDTRPATLERELASVLNRYSAENGSNTPDWILADYLRGCLAAFDSAVQARGKWYGRMDAPGHARAFEVASPLQDATRLRQHRLVYASRWGRLELEQLEPLSDAELGEVCDDIAIMRRLGPNGLLSDADREAAGARFERRFGQGAPIGAELVVTGRRLYGKPPAPAADPGSREVLGRANFRVALAIKYGMDILRTESQEMLARTIGRVVSVIADRFVAVTQVTPFEIVLYTRDRPNDDQIAELKKLTADARGLYLATADPGDLVRVDEVVDPLGEDRRKLDWFMDLYSRAKMAPPLLSNLTGQRWVITTAGTLPELAAKAALSELGVLDAPTELLRAELAGEHLKNADGLARKIGADEPTLRWLEQAEEAIATLRNRLLDQQPIAAAGGLAHNYRNLLASMARDAARELGATPEKPRKVEIVTGDALSGDQSDSIGFMLRHGAGPGGATVRVIAAAAGDDRHDFPRPILIGAGKALEDAPWPIDWRDLVRALFAAGLHTNDDIPQG